jgi:hypothetical protein
MDVAWARFGAAVLALSWPLSAATSATAADATTVAAVGQARLEGSVRDSAGAPVVDARVTVTGPRTLTTTTDASGTFALALPPGIYQIAIAKGGYNPVSLPGIAAAADTTTPVSVTMSQADLNSLRTIGTITSTTRGSAINTGPAAASFLPAEAIKDFGAPQINDVLQHLPDVTIQKMGSQPDQSIIIGGVQPYETQVLIDGHPIALGQYGVWVSTYFPSFLVGGIETQSGPGNTTPFANLAVGGTANILTPGFTSKPTSELTFGVDNYGSQWSSLLATGSVGRLEYVADLGTSGLNTPFTSKNECLVIPDGGNPGYGVVSDCTSADSDLYQKGMLFKLKYDFTPTTSFDVGYVGAWGGFYNQGTAWGTYLGQTTIEQCQSNGIICSNPNYANLYGKTITGYAWYTGSSIYNDQALYTAQFRTSFGNTTLLVRPYIGNIEPEATMGYGQVYFPQFFGPPGSYSYGNGVTPPASYLSGVYATNAAGAPAPTAGTPSEQACAASGTVTAPNGTFTVVNNQWECYYAPYSTYEQDKLYGMTTSIIQPLGGDNLLNFTYDFHGQSTFAYINSPSAVSVPFSTDRYSTFSLTGQVALTPWLQTNLGLYDTLWNVNGVQLANPSDTSSTALTGLNRTVSHFDPHLAFVGRPNNNLVFRFSAGTSTTYPFVGQVSGLATYELPACSLGPPFWNGGTLTEKNPNLQPETSIGYNAGADVRLPNNSFLGVNLQQTIVHGVFEQLTTEVVSPLPPLCGGSSVEGIFSPVNVARLVANSVTLKYNYAPRVGFGFNLAATAASSILSGLTPQLFSAGSASVPANNVQICGNGVAAPGIATCVPYLQGYAQFTFTSPRGTFVGLGVDYQGKNNAYFQPPFALADLVARRPITRNAEVQLSVQNLLNTNNYGAYLPIPGAGTPLVADTTNASFSSLQQTSFTPALIPAPARYVRLQVRLHAGR